LTCKIHLATDALGRPLALVLTGGNAADTTYFTTVLDAIRVHDGRPGRSRTRPDRVLADKAYTSAANRGFLTGRGIKVTTSSNDASTSSSSGAASPPASTRPPGPTSPDSPSPQH
jgi:transposase